MSLDQVRGKIEGPVTLDRHTSLHGMWSATSSCLLAFGLIITG